MTITRRQFLCTSGLAAVYLGLPALFTGCATKQTPVANPLAWASDTTAIASTTDTMALQVLRRLTYGPTPTEFARVRQIGTTAFIEEQLHPEQIDDRDSEQRVAAFETLSVSSAELLKRFPRQGQSGPQTIMSQLQQASMVRAVSSKRQLQEIMVDVWSNHLNIYLGKGLAKWLKTADDRDVIRPYALGKFRDLLLASAKSPAMLVYLDGVDNTLPGARQGAGGLNENYARELLELHTLGADAGYDHDDIVAVARAFTGWSIVRQQDANAGSFLFRPRLHDNAAKQIKVLNLDLPAGGGIADGEAVIARLAIDPRTAARIARKLCARFVADDPPQALVDRVAQTYLSNDTDIRATLSAIFQSSEFAAAAPKVKLPHHALVSMLRATGAQIHESGKLMNLLVQLGQPFFGWQAPDGYPQEGAAWINTSGMLARWNAAFAVAEERVAGVTVDLRTLLAAGSQLTAAHVVDEVTTNLLHEDIGQEARQALIDFIGGADPATMVDARLVDQVLPGVVGLVLASPVFQLY